MNWSLPDVSTLPRSLTTTPNLDAAVMGERLQETLTTLGAPCEVSRVVVGPSVARIELSAAPGVKMHSFTRLKRADDLAYALGSESVTITAPIPGRSLIGVEVALPDRTSVGLGDVVGAARAPLRAALGLDVDGSVVTLDLDDPASPHALVAGRSGGGKSVLLHGIIASLLTRCSPDDLALVLADPKMTEMTCWEGLPHLYGRVLTSVDRIINGLWWCVGEMEARYRAISAAGCRDVTEYNALSDRRFPRCLIVVDELADLMMQSRGEVESAVVRLGQKGRAAGMHMILATQSPRANVITGLLKSNLPARIALATSSALDSRIILDRNGSESLLGRGDLLYDDGISGALRRAQAPMVDRETIRMLRDHWVDQVDTREEIAA